MERPNVTVVYQDAPTQPIGCMRLMLELFLLVVFVGCFIVGFMFF